ncbi:MAG: cupredoxin domain-containing protein [bacterium]|nr:cupredoxin domain-containing protein [bacterium]
MNKTILVIAGVLIVIVGGYFLLRGTPGPGAGQPVETPLATQTPAAGVTEISVSGNEFSFSPASINVKAGERVKITFRNIGQAPHNLVLEGLGITTKTINGGQTDVVEFIAPAAGTYAFFCSIPGHRSAGMEGSLKVE